MIVHLRLYKNMKTKHVFFVLCLFVLVLTILIMLDHKRQMIKDLTADGSKRQIKDLRVDDSRRQIRNLASDERKHQMMKDITADGSKWQMIKEPHPESKPSKTERLPQTTSTIQTLSTTTENEKRLTTSTLANEMAREAQEDGVKTTESASSTTTQNVPNSNSLTPLTDNFEKLPQTTPSTQTTSTTTENEKRLTTSMLANEIAMETQGDGVKTTQLASNITTQNVPNSNSLTTHLTDKFGYANRDFQERTLEDHNTKVLLTSDAFERMSGYKYFGIIDLDEFLIPSNDRSLKQYLADLYKTYKNAAGFSFLPVTYFLSYGHHGTGNDLILGRYITRQINERNMARKNIYEPKYVQSWRVGTHTVHPINGLQIVSLPKYGDGFRHYRACYKVDCENNWKRVNDTWVAEWSRRIADNVHRVRYLLFGNKSVIYPE